MNKAFKVAICQMKVCNDKQKNIDKAIKMIRQSKGEKSDIVVLPEMFNCPYSNDVFLEFSESLADGETISSISNVAKENNLYIVAGSIPEFENGKIYNTSIAFGKDGKIIGKHRKIHLFDIDIKDKITFRESDTLSAGADVTLIDTEFCRMGIAICYDIRFPELFRVMSLGGAELIVIPAAFNMVTGPAHWDITLRTRAIDNQVFIAAASPARDKNANYISYANSMVVDPWGKVLVEGGIDETIIYCDIDLEYLNKIREELPLLRHRRMDLYSSL